MLDKVDEVEDDLQGQYRSYRQSVLHRKLSEVSKEQQVVDGETIDFVDIQAAQLRLGSSKSACMQSLKVVEQDSTCECKQFDGI